MEHNRFYSRNHGLLTPKTGGCNPIDEASEPQQSPKGSHVLSDHRLHHRIHLMRSPTLAAM